MTAARAITWALVVVALSAALAGCGLAQAGTRPQLAAPTTPADVSVSSTPCFGAVARAPGHPCASAARPLGVVPTPAVAAVTPNAPCNSAHVEGPLYVCSFGVPARRARRTIALIGDSHAAMWRAALAPIARAERWHGISIVHPGCPLNALVRQIGGALRDASCGTWQRAIIPWLRRNPEVSAMFVGGLSDSPFIRPSGEPNFPAAVGGYQQIWKQVPSWIQHIVVMRDTPRYGPHNLECVNRAMDAGAQAGLVCAVPRSTALPPDPQLVAAIGMHSPRFQAIDVNNEICSARWCYPVVGGALVLKDITHMTRTFAATLAPAVMSRVEVLTRSWAPASGAGLRRGT